MGRLIKARLLFLIVIFSLFCSFIIDERIEKVYVQMRSKQLQAGKTISVASEICFQPTGSMVTHFIHPLEYIVITNKLGEIKIYDPSKNTVLTKQNMMFSSESTQLVYFLKGKVLDMGLYDLGFTPLKTYPEKNIIVTEWSKVSNSQQSSVKTVKLVHQQQRPIYMDYKDAEGKIIRKVFYYNYIQVNKLSFPTSTVEIIYNSALDSTITKTIYSDFKINKEATSQYFDFKVPTTAKKIG